MSSGRFDWLERQAADNIDGIFAEVEKDRDELARYLGRRPTVGAQQGFPNAAELLNALRELSRSLRGG
jgi:hypothetical protein